MGYYLKMNDILELQTRSQKQIACWKEELQKIVKTMEVLGDTKELEGQAGIKLKDNIKNVHMPIKAEIEDLLYLFEETYSKYVLGLKELEESNTAIVKQDVLEGQQEEMNLYKDRYIGIYEDVVAELSKVSDLISYCLGFHVSEKLDKLVNKLTDTNTKLGEYDVSHANDMSLLDEEMSLLQIKLSKVKE